MGFLLAHCFSRLCLPALLSHSHILFPYSSPTAQPLCYPPFCSHSIAHQNMPIISPPVPLLLLHTLLVSYLLSSSSRFLRLPYFHTLLVRFDTLLTRLHTSSFFCPAVFAWSPSPSLLFLSPALDHSHSSLLFSVLSLRIFRACHQHSCSFRITHSQETNTEQCQSDQIWQESQPAKGGQIWYQSAQDEKGSRITYTKR